MHLLRSLQLLITQSPKYCPAPFSRSTEEDYASAHFGAVRTEDGDSVQVQRTARDPSAHGPRGWKISLHHGHVLSGHTAADSTSTSLLCCQEHRDEIRLQFSLQHSRVSAVSPMTHQPRSLCRISCFERMLVGLRLVNS